MLRHDNALNFLSDIEININKSISKRKIYKILKKIWNNNKKIMKIFITKIKKIDEINEK